MTAEKNTIQAGQKYHVYLRFGVQTCKNRIIIQKQCQNRMEKKKTTEYFVVLTHITNQQHF